MIRAGRLYRLLFGAYGPQQWWPASDTFEIMAGALLVQRTAWRNAEAAILNLRAAGLMTPPDLAAAPGARIERCIRPAGFYRSKAARLRKLAQWYVQHGRLLPPASVATKELRDRLLSLEGVGPETADVILLYAFDRPVVVIDEYLRRLARRLGPATRQLDDPALRRWIERDLGDLQSLNEVHALVVEHGKRFCSARPVCGACPLRTACETGRADSDAELGERVSHFAEDA